MKTTIKEVEGGLSVWSDEVTTLQSVVTDLKAEVAVLRAKCEDIEGRIRRCNVRILGVAETDGSSSTMAVSRLLRQTLQFEKDVRIEVWLQEDQMENHAPSWLNFIITKTVSRC